jgi:hypothetical protein
VAVKPFASFVHSLKPSSHSLSSFVFTLGLHHLEVSLFVLLVKAFQGGCLRLSFPNGIACGNLLFSWQEVMLPVGLMSNGSEATACCYKVWEGGQSSGEESCQMSVRRFKVNQECLLEPSLFIPIS